MASGICTGSPPEVTLYALAHFSRPANMKVHESPTKAVLLFFYNCFFFSIYVLFCFCFYLEFCETLRNILNCLFFQNTCQIVFFPVSIALKIWHRIQSHLLVPLMRFTYIGKINRTGDCMAESPSISKLSLKCRSRFRHCWSRNLYSSHYQMGQWII